jgi:serine/threonine protein kinase
MSDAGDERLLLCVIGDERPPAELPRSGRLVIGSSAEKVDLVLDGQGVAEVHCALGRARSGGWALKDLGSAYGTIVNGERVSQARLAAGDVITLGSRRLEIVRPRGEGAAAPLVEEPAAPPPAPLVEEPAAPASPKPAPRRRLPSIPGYRFERRLGRGSMGDVYLALQESLDRQVAIKVLPSRLASEPGFVQRFQAEARAAAALHHQNVVTVHDVGEAAGLHFLSMEYMDGGSLEERVAKEGQLHWRTVLEILHDAASGLMYAESRGIVHRDIKPANLMQNHAGVTKIADLGLATHTDAEEDGDRRIFGTPHFISPEQVRGGQADSRSDLYSLGATAYRLLSGHTPFEGDSSRAILRAKLLEDPRPLEKLVSDLPEPVREVIARAMQREPDRRYPTASALLSDINRVASGAREQAALGGSPPAPASTRRVPWAALAAVALLAGGGAWWASRPADAGGGSSLDPSNPPPARGGTDDPLAEPGPGPEPEPAPEPEPPAVDDDTQEQLFETQAELAFTRLAQNDLPPAERIARLRALAAEYDGTDAAAAGLDLARQVQAEVRATDLAQREYTDRLDAVLTSLRTAAALEQRPVRAADSLRRMYAIGDQAPFEGEPRFLTEREKLEAQLIQLALAHIDEDLAAAEKLQSQGEFARLREALIDIKARTDLPPFPEDRTPAGADRMLEVRRRVRERLDAMGADEGRFAAEHRRADNRRLVHGLGGPLGLEAELGRMDLAAAEVRLEALRGELTLPAHREWVSVLAAEVEASRAALEFIAAEYPRWRRKTVADPRSARSPRREVIGADADGLRVDVAGVGESIPWSAFGGRTRELDFLFSERISGPYPPERAAGVAALVKLCAVVDAARQAAEMFDLESEAVFTRKEASTLRETLDLALSWAREAGDSLACEGERAAADLLATVLTQASAQTWSGAFSGLQRLLEDHGETLLVRLLSDGRGVEPPPVRSPEGAAAPGAAEGEDEQAGENATPPSPAPPRPPDEPRPADGR